MKKTDLEKNKAVKLISQLKHSGPPERYAVGSAPATLDRREQRKVDQAAGLVSFPIKLKQPLIDILRAQAQEQQKSVNDIVGELLEKALKG